MVTEARCPRKKATWILRTRARGVIFGPGRRTIDKGLMMLQAIGDRLVIEPRKAPAERASESILLAPTVAAKIPPTQGRVLHAGGRVRRIKVGDHVTWGFGSGTEVEHEGQTFLIVSEQDIVAVNR